MTETPIDSATCFTFVDEDGEEERFALSRVCALAQQLVSQLEPQLTEERSAVVVDLPNCPLFIGVLLACAQLGRPLVALNHRLSESEKVLRLEQLRSHIAIGVTIDANWMERAKWVATSSPVIPDGSHASDWKPLDTLRNANPDALALVMFTSGTSGIPKAAKLTWLQLLSSAETANQSLQCGPETHWQAALPLYHIGGLQVIVRSLLSETPFILYRRWDAARTLEDAQRFGATHISVVDKMLQDLIAADNEHAGNARVLSAYRCILLGGAAVNEQTLAKARRAHARVYASFGMTETASLIANCLVDGSFNGGLDLLPNVDARILNPDGQGRGILAVRGPASTGGYLNALAPRTEDGFFITGDTARLDDGKLFVYERADDLFISGGENVYPAEIERSIKQIPGITDCYVFGVRDDVWGMRPVALVETALEPARAEELVREHARKQLTRFCQPDRIVAVEAMPRSGIGKIDRAAARALVMR